MPEPTLVIKGGRLVDATGVRSGDVVVGDDGSILAVESANSPADFMVGKKLIASGRPVDPVRLADPAVPLRDLLGR